MFFLQAKPFFERESVRLVHFMAEIGLVDPGAGLVNPDHRIPSRDLLQTDKDIHGVNTLERTPRSRGRFDYPSEYRLKIRAPLVPPNPNELVRAYSISMARALSGT